MFVSASRFCFLLSKSLVTVPTPTAASLVTSASHLGVAGLLLFLLFVRPAAADLSLALEHAIAGNAETQNTIKKYQQQVRDAQVKVDEESAAKSAAADAKVSADRKAAAMQNAL